VVFVADDLGAWLIGLLADRGRKRLTTVVLGSDQERALRSAATAAVQLTARDLRPGGGEQAAQLAMVISQVFNEPMPRAQVAGQATLLEALQAGVAEQLAPLDDPSLTGTGSSSAEVLGIPATELAEKLNDHLLQQIKVQGASGGPLTPLADQLNHDATQLQNKQIEAKIDRLPEELQKVLPPAVTPAQLLALLQGPTGRDAEADQQGSVPTAVLKRHGALVLDPDVAVAVPGYPAPQSTVYRARTLLVPGDLLEEPFITAINTVLARAGMKIIPPAPDSDSGGPGSGVLKQRSRLVALVPAAYGDGTAALPVAINSWVALQTLRATASAGALPSMDEAAVCRITLEHLLTGRAISVGEKRTSAGIIQDAPARMPSQECASRYGRRPVVAVLDTGIRAHPWLDVRAARPGGWITDPDGFVAVDGATQAAIRLEGEVAAASGDRPRQLISHPWDTPVAEDLPDGDLDTDTGRGTFIAGIMRQTVPNATVLAVRVAHSDGVAYEGDLLCALGLLADRIAAAEEGDMAAMIDVISLSLGYFSESVDAAYCSGLRGVIDKLLSMGVVVVAGAGDASTSSKFYPAAFAEPSIPGQVPLISVGALNLDGSIAASSNSGRWVTAWAQSAAIVSTFPIDLSLPAHVRSLDPNAFAGGFVSWNGPWFSAPRLAARVAAGLLTGAADGPELRLDQPGATAATTRVRHALQSLGWQD
jgi:Subtilase family